MPCDLLKPNGQIYTQSQQNNIRATFENVALMLFYWLWTGICPLGNNVQIQKVATSSPGSFVSFLYRPSYIDKTQIILGKRLRKLLSFLYGPSYIDKTQPSAQKHTQSQYNNIRATFENVALMLFYRLWTGICPLGNYPLGKRIVANFEVIAGAGWSNENVGFILREISKVLENDRRHREVPFQ